jgi:O-antigen/teichoic acid export membrane protein
MSFLQAVRSVLSVLAGYLLFAVSAFLIFKLFKQPPHQAAPLGFMVITTALGMFFALLGGYVSGLLAGRNPLGHAIGVAVILALGASVSLMSTLGKGAIWTQIAAIVFMAPSAIAGGWMRFRQCTRA